MQEEGGTLLGVIKKGIGMSHRYNRLPLLCSQPGGVQQELVASLCHGRKVKEEITNFEFVSGT